MVADTNVSIDITYTPSENESLLNQTVTLGFMIRHNDEDNATNIAFETILEEHPKIEKMIQDSLADLERNNHPAHTHSNLHESLKDIQHLNISSLDCTTSRDIEVIEAFGAWSAGIKSLSCRGTYMGMSGWGYLKYLLGGDHFNLTHLELEDCGIDEQVVKGVAEYLYSDKGKTLSSLRLSKPYGNPKNLGSLFDELREHPSLTHLEICEWKINDTSAQYLESMIVGNKVLKSLGLKNCSFSDARGYKFTGLVSYATFNNTKRLFRALIGNSSIEHLDLTGFDVTNCGDITLGIFFKSNLTLKSLVVDHAKISWGQFDVIHKIISDQTSKMTISTVGAHGPSENKRKRRANNIDHSGILKKRKKEL